MRGWMVLGLASLSCAVPFTTTPEDSKINYLEDSGQVDSDTPQATPAPTPTVDEDTDLWDDSSPDTDAVDPQGTTQTPPGPGTGGTTNPPTTGGTEDCGDFVDDDGDGLVDCEDGDCANSPLCVETGCNDGIDNEGDGWVDCMDDDCWGQGCAVITTRITGGRWDQDWNSVMVNQTLGGVPQRPTQDSDRDLRLTALTGVLTAKDPWGNITEQCNFIIGNSLAEEDVTIHSLASWTMDFQFNSIQMPTNCSLDYRRTVPEALAFPYPMDLTRGPYAGQWQQARTYNYWTPPQRAFNSWLRLGRTSSVHNTTTTQTPGASSMRTTFTRTSFAQGNILPGTSYTRPYP